MRIGVVAPSCTLDPTIPDRIAAFLPPGCELEFHPQCFFSQGHFAGPDSARVDAFVEVANDPSFDAVWFARGGHGACRVAESALARLGYDARDKHYLGYSDAGFILAGLKAKRIGRPAHGPMPADINRPGGEAAIVRALSWMTSRPPSSEGNLAFNLTVLSQLLGTSLQPDFTDQILMIEEVSEYMYRIDRSLFHVMSNPDVRKVRGIMLGRCSDIPSNEPDFAQDEEALCRLWCSNSGIPYLGRADIGHDAENKIVTFG